jgi:hypothetical protein
MMSVLMGVCITGSSGKNSVTVSGTKEQETAAETTDNNGNPHYLYKLIFYSSHHQVAHFRVTAELCDIATQTAKLTRMKTAENSQCSKVSEAVLVA